MDNNRGHPPSLWRFSVFATEAWQTPTTETHNRRWRRKWESWTICSWASWGFLWKVTKCDGASRLECQSRVGKCCCGYCFETGDSRAHGIQWVQGFRRGDIDNAKGDSAKTEMFNSVSRQDRKQMSILKEKQKKMMSLHTQIVCRICLFVCLFL